MKKICLFVALFAGCAGIMNAGAEIVVQGTVETIVDKRPT